MSNREEITITLKPVPETVALTIVLPKRLVDILRSLSRYDLSIPDLLAEDGYDRSDVKKLLDGLQEIPY